MPNQNRRLCWGKLFIIVVFVRKIILLAILIALMVLYGKLGLCEETKVLKLENRILSLIDKRDKQGEKFDSKAYWDAIDEIDTLSQEEATTLLVRLFDYYLGEGTDELLLEKVTQMGDKILPYLVQKRNVPRMTCRNEYKEMCHTIQERNYLIDEAIKGIKDGIVLCYEHPVVTL